MIIGTIIALTILMLILFYSIRIESREIKSPADKLYPKKQERFIPVKHGFLDLETGYILSNFKNEICKKYVLIQDIEKIPDEYSDMSGVYIGYIAGESDE